MNEMTLSEFREIALMREASFTRIIADLERKLAYAQSRILFPGTWRAASHEDGYDGLYLIREGDGYAFELNQLEDIRELAATINNLELQNVQLQKKVAELEAANAS